MKPNWMESGYEERTWKAKTWQSIPPTKPGWYWVRFVYDNLMGNTTYLPAYPREFDGEKVLGNGDELYPAGIYINLRAEFWPMCIERPSE